MLSLALALLATTLAHAQQTSFARLPSEQLDVMAPSARVRGTPGSMAVREAACRNLPDAQVRQRIVDVATQEWAFFGFLLVDRTAPRVERPAFVRGAAGGATDARRRARRRFRWLDPVESARVAGTIGGYWAVTPEGRWILDNQNTAWNGEDGVAARWRDPWSAAFVSWVMCEGGLGDAQRFRRAVAHHAYIDQAIRARDGADARGAFVAYDIGERPVLPGDLLCSGRRPAYRSLAERRRQMGEGARTHCDIVVKVDAVASRILAIGGNVRGAVSLKVLPAVGDGAALHATQDVDSGTGLFAHLKLRTAPVAADALDHTPTMKAIACAAGFELPASVAAAGLVTARADVPAGCGRVARTD